MEWLEGLAGTPWFPLLIFCSRLADVSLGTLRIILISRGNRRWATITGFFESAVWLIAISQVFAHLDRPSSLLAYAGGFAAGTWLGVTIEKKIALGLVSVRIITREDASRLAEVLREERFGVTMLGARGLHGRVRLIFCIAKRREMDRLLEIVRGVDPKAFVSVSDVRTADEGYLPGASRTGFWGRLLVRRK